MVTYSSQERKTFERHPTVHFNGFLKYHAIHGEYVTNLKMYPRKCFEALAHRLYMEKKADLSDNNE